MQKYFEEFISEILKTSKLPPAKQKNLERELYSHLYDRKRELELQGYGEEKIIEKIKLSFGDTKLIAKELHMVDTNLTMKDWLLRGVFFWCLSVMVITFINMAVRCPNSTVASCVSGLTFVSVFSPLVSFLMLLASFTNEFSLIFLIVNIIVIVFLYSILSLFKKYFSPSLEPKRVLALIFSAAVLLNWLSIFISVRTIPYTSESYAIEHFLPYSTAGFPHYGESLCAGRA